MDLVQRYKVPVAIGLAVVVSISLVWLVFSANSSAVCSPSGSLSARAADYLKDLKAEPAADKSALARLSSYLVLLDEPNGFLELELKQFARAKDSPSAGTETLTFEFDCAKLELTLKRQTGTKPSYQFAELSLSVRKPGGAEHKFDELCRADASQSQLSFVPSLEYFSCRGTIALNCQARDKDARGTEYLKTRAEVVFNLLELELDGDPKNAARGEWTRTPKAGSCPARIE